MELRPGTVDDAQAVADFWNSRSGDENSSWKFVPTKTSEEIQEFLGAQTLFVAYEGESLVGFGLWDGESMSGVLADNSEAFYRLAKEWCLQNPGRSAKIMMPASSTTERTWLEATGVWTFRPYGHKPLKEGDDPSQRTLWTVLGSVNLDEFLQSINVLLGG